MVNGYIQFVESFEEFPTCGFQRGTFSPFCSILPWPFFLGFFSLFTIDNNSMKSNWKVL